MTDFRSRIRQNSAVFAPAKVWRLRLPQDAVVSSEASTQRRCTGVVACACLSERGRAFALWIEALESPVFLPLSRAAELDEIRVSAHHNWTSGVTFFTMAWGKKDRCTETTVLITHRLHRALVSAGQPVRRENLMRSRKPRARACAILVGHSLMPIAMILSALDSPTTALAQEAQTAEDLEPLEQQRTDAYAAQLEAYLRQWLVEEYPGRAAKAWSRDYSSMEAFLKSVEPNRRRWRNVVKPPELQKTGELKRRPHPPLVRLNAQWLTLPLGALTAEGLLAAPAGASARKPAPLVIVQHGIGSHPERTFGVLDEGEHYHRYAEELIRAGFVVLAPMNLRSVERRNRIERLCRLADTSLPGIELVRTQRLLDEVLKDPRIDGQRIGMWGVSLGGLATMFWMPLEPRIKAGVVAAWFNHRRNKMVFPDSRYSCFLETKEEHAFFQGWLTEFTDSDVVSLICPRPLLIQTGKQDRIAHWPQVVEEFEASRAHYEKLGVAERFEMDLHEGGHEPRVRSGLEFLSRWLMEEGKAPSTSSRSDHGGR